MNVTAAAVLGLEIGIEESIVRRGIEAIRYVKGRMEKVDSRKGDLTLIDYAHTPDALENVLRAVRNITNKRLLLVFGCGGDRDKGKRMEMGKISESLADLVILTSDNPRTEDPETILQDILKAICRALDCAREGDTVLIAGKGHETYQEIGAEKIPFNDREVVESYLDSREEE
jgi:UDP-N-acetylmuramoyl-L-alanyl-D-glutamate--2,6-diaminopimelate ligase